MIELCALLAATGALCAAHLSCVCSTRAVAASPLAAVRARLGSSRHTAARAAAAGPRVAAPRAYAPLASCLAQHAPSRASACGTRAAVVDDHASASPLAAPNRDTRHPLSDIVTRAIPYVRLRPHTTLDRCPPREGCSSNYAPLRRVRPCSCFSLLVRLRLRSPG